MLVYWFVRHKVTEPLYVGRKPAANINLHQLHRCKKCLKVFFEPTNMEMWAQKPSLMVKSSSLQLEMGK
jgi:hypothetical protein